MRPIVLLKRMKNLKFIILTSLIITAIVLFRFTDLGAGITPDAIRAFVLSFGALSPLVYIAIYTIAPVFMVPEPLSVLLQALPLAASMGLSTLL